MQEVEGLTVDAIDWIVEGIRAQGGETSYGWWNERRCLGCALGSIGYSAGFRRSDHLEWKSPDVLNRAIDVGLAHRNGNLTHVSDWVSAANGERDSTGALIVPIDHKYDYERGQQMLAWLQAQRDLKCCDWTPPARELSGNERQSLLKEVNHGG